MSKLMMGIVYVVRQDVGTGKECPHECVIAVPRVPLTPPIMDPLSLPDNVRGPYEAPPPPMWFAREPLAPFSFTSFLRVFPLFPLSFISFQGYSKIFFFKRIFFLIFMFSFHLIFINANKILLSFLKKKNQFQRFCYKWIELLK